MNGKEGVDFRLAKCTLGTKTPLIPNRRRRFWERIKDIISTLVVPTSTRSSTAQARESVIFVEDLVPGPNY